MKTQLGDSSTIAITSSYASGNDGFPMIRVVISGGRYYAAQNGSGVLSTLDAGSEGSTNPQPAQDVP